MDYSLAISSDLGIDTYEFSSVWNRDPASQDIAHARPDLPASKRGANHVIISSEMLRQGIVLLAGIAGTVTLDIIKDLIKDRIKKIIDSRSSSDAAPAFELIVIPPSDAPLIVVVPKVECVAISPHQSCLYPCVASDLR